MILTRTTSEKIKEIRQKIKKIQPQGWMCEGADDRCNQFFNNDTEAFFLATYEGKIVSKDGDIPFEMYEVAKLEGEISLLIEKEEKQNA